MVWSYKGRFAQQRASLFEDEAHRDGKRKKLGPHGIL